MSGTRGIRLFAIAVLSLSSLLVAAPHRAAAQDADARRDEVRQEIPVELARRIDDAVDRGVAFLSKRQGEDGGWSLGRSLDGTRIFDSPGGRLMFEGALGRTARAAEALLDAGVPASDRRIARAAAWIEAGMDRLDRAPPPAICLVEYASSVLRLRLRLGLLDERSRALRDGILHTRAGDGTFLGAGDHPSNLVPYGWCSSTCDAMSALALARKRRDQRSVIERASAQ